MQPGPITREQLDRFGRNWEQGDHVVVSGPTKSGKTTLSRVLVQKRIDRGGHSITMVGKLQPDPTIMSDYKGFTRWTSWKKSPPSSENKILLWPNTDRYKTISDKRKLQQEVFKSAFDMLSNIGRYTLHIDEGLYTCSSSFLGLGDEVGMLHALGRSAKLSILTTMQRPAHIPLIVFSSATDAFIGRTREEADRKRLAEMGSREGSRELQSRISAQGIHDFLWVPIGMDAPAEALNFSR